MGFNTKFINLGQAMKGRLIMKPTEDKSIMQLDMILRLTEIGARVNNIHMFKGNVVTELTVYLSNFRKLTYNLTLYPIRKQVIKITAYSGEVLEEKPFDHVFHALKFIQSEI